MSIINPGIYKDTYRGLRIFWRGTYNIEGEGSYQTIREARAEIDRIRAAEEAHRVAEIQAKVAAGQAMLARKHPPYITLETPDGPLTMTLREYRAQVFNEDSIEARYGMEVIVV